MTPGEMDSKRVSNNFHGALGKDGLSDLSRRTWDRAILKQVESFLRKDRKILDIGCGYGRIAVPLVKKGYDVSGIDISVGYIKELRRGLADKRLSRRFKVADMCKLPFSENTFDVALCLWSVFDELLLRKEQVTALREMRRVLKKGGLAFIESHIYTDPAQIDKIKMGSLCGYQKRIVKCSVTGAKYHYYNHDNESLRNILLRSGVRNFSVSEEWFGWRERMITRFIK